MADSSIASEGFAVKVAGALSGVCFVPSIDANVSSLRAEVARLLGIEDPSAVKLILAGRQMQDTQTLRACGVTAASRVLVTRGAGAGAGAVNSEADKQQRLERVKRVVEGLASHRGSDESYELALEDQSGSSVRYKPEDQKALVMGLTMHSRGKTSMEEGRLPAALDELLLAEECFSLCDPTLLSGIDNFGMLQLDIVWCAYKLQDVRRLAVCRERLSKARAALERAWGTQLERARRLHGSELCVELATSARLDAMEGVVAYYLGDYAAAQASLAAAQQKISKLQVSDQHLATMQDMGFKLRESKRALKFSGNDLEAAVAYVGKQRVLKEERKARRARQAEWGKQRRRHGRTATGAYVEVEPLDALLAMGYEIALAAEALRQTDNNANAALESLLDPGKRAALGLAAALTGAETAVSGGGAGAGEEDGGVGEEGRALARALAESMTQALQQQQQQQQAGGAAGSGQEATNGEAGPSERRSSANGGGRGRGSGSGGAAGAEAGPLGVQKTESDEELEEEILAGVKRGQDPMDAYDVELDEEAEVVNTYMALLQSKQS